MTIRNTDVPLMVIHGALSAIVHAANVAFGDISHRAWMEWHNGTHLNLCVECFARHSDRVATQLSQGLTHREYDYRFKAVSRPMGESPHDYVVVSGMMALSHNPPEEAKLARWKEMEARA